MNFNLANFNAANFNTFYNKIGHKEVLKTGGITLVVTTVALLALKKLYNCATKPEKTTQLRSKNTDRTQKSNYNTLKTSLVALFVLGITALAMFNKALEINSLEDFLAPEIVDIDLGVTEPVAESTPEAPVAESTPEAPVAESTPEAPVDETVTVVIEEEVLQEAPVVEPETIEVAQNETIGLIQIIHVEPASMSE